MQLKALYIELQPLLYYITVELIVAALAFIVQNLFDEAQIVANNVGPPIKAEQWQFIHNIGNDLKRTLANVTSVAIGNLFIQ